MTDLPSSDRKWHLERKVPIALIATIVVQTICIVWWAATLSERVNVLERSARAVEPQAERITRIEVKLENVQEGVKRIEQLLQRRPEN